jgi:hypothetical protein
MPTMTAWQAETTTSEIAGNTDEDVIRLDAYASSLVARLAPIRFGIAITEREREDVYRLRYLAVIERDWAKPGDFPDGLEREPDDEEAVLVGAWDGETLIAAGRIIFPIEGSPLPIERIFDIAIEPRGRVVQVDRLTVASSCRDHSSRLFYGITAQCWIELRKRGISTCVGFESEGMLRFWGRLGFSKTILGPARSYWGEPRYPVRFEPSDAALDLVERVLARF